MNTPEKRDAYFAKVAELEQELEDIQTMLYFLQRPHEWNKGTIGKKHNQESVYDHLRSYVGCGMRIGKIVEELSEGFGEIIIDV